MFHFPIMIGWGGGGGGRVVIPRTEVASKNSPAFRELCDALKRNDPSLTAVTTPAERTSTPDAYGRRLGTALTSNTVVTEIALNLATFLSQTDQQAGTTNSAAPLLQWISQSPSLRTVKLNYDAGYGSQDEVELEPVEEDLLQRILHEMATNPRIQALDSSLINFSPLVLTEYLTTPKPNLKFLRVTLFSDDDDDDDLFRDVHDDDSTSNLQGKAAAQAIGALTTLETLALRCDDVFLSLLSTTMTTPTTPQVRPRVATELLCELTVDFMNQGDANVELFASVLTSSTQLVIAGIHDLTMDVASWTLISSALGSNATITTLKVSHCYIEDDVMTLFKRDMQSSDPSRQHVRHLEMTECEGERPLAVLIAKMLHGSLLHHITLDSGTITMHEELEFFTALARDTDKVRLRSLKLNTMSRGILRCVSQSSYLARTVHLRRLSIQTRLGNNGVVNRAAYNERAAATTGVMTPSRSPLINNFLATLRRNGSLHHVEIITHDESLVQTDPLLAEVWHIIEAFTARNRLSPEVLKTSFVVQDDDDASSSLPTSLPSSGALFATLCQVAEQAPRMSPNSLLMGLQSASQSLNGPTFDGTTTGKRVRAALVSAAAQDKGAARKSRRGISKKCAPGNFTM